MKRFFAAILALSMMLAMIATPALAEATAKLTETPVTITYMRTENEPTPIQSGTAAQKQILERTGINFEIIPVSENDYDTKMTALYAANDLPDIFKPFSISIREMAEDGAILDLTDLLTEYAPDLKHDLDTIPNLNRALIDGRVYSLPQIRRDANYEMGALPMIRMDLLEKNNLPVPTTFVELADTLEKLGEIYPDSIPWGSREHYVIIGISSRSWLGSFGADYNPYMDDEGVWHFGRIEPNFKDAVIYANDLVNRGVLDSEYVTTSQEAWIEGLSNGKYLFYYDNPVFAAQINAALATVDPDAYLAPIEILENPYGYRLNYKTPDNESNTFCVSADCENPELVVKFLAWAYGEEGTLTLNYGYEGETYYIDENGDPQWTQEIIDKYADNTNAYYALQSDLGISNNVFTPSWLCTACDRFLGVSDGTTIDSKYIYEMFKDDDYIVPEDVLPPLSPEQSARITEIQQAIDSYSETEINKFVLGQRPMDEYDSFVADLIAKGAGEYADILNEAEAEFQALIAK